MNIISGAARGVELTVPETLAVRPTAVRARKALFDSLGDLSALHVLDLFSGSGALALEAASRGAASAVLVENSPDQLLCIRENCRRCAAAGVTTAVTVFDYDALEPQKYLPRLAQKPQLIFADPPYAASGEAFRTLLASDAFRKNCAGAKLVWEIPDTPGAAGAFLNHAALASSALRRFGGTLFLIGVVA